MERALAITGLPNRALDDLRPGLLRVLGVDETEVESVVNINRARTIITFTTRETTDRIFATRRRAMFTKFRILELTRMAPPEP